MGFSNLFQISFSNLFQIGFSNLPEVGISNLSGMGLSNLLEGQSNCKLKKGPASEKLHIDLFFPIKSALFNLICVL